MCVVRLRAQIGEIDVAIFQACDRHDLEPGHDRARRIRSVGGSRNEADVAMRLVARSVILANREQSGVFALRSGIRLQRNRGESRDLREPIFQLLAHFAIAGRLIVRRKRMQLRKFRPRNRKHLRRRVQLHRAGAERNHRMAERKIARFQFAQVAQHFRFGVVRVENRMRQEFRTVRLAMVDSSLRHRRNSGTPNCSQISRRSSSRRRFVERNADRSCGQVCEGSSQLWQPVSELKRCVLSSRST